MTICNIGAIQPYMLEPNKDSREEAEELSAQVDVLEL